jgi:hypothetical protein
MGNTLSIDLAGFVGSDTLALENAVRIQLQNNHFPPIPEFFIPVCLQAIELANQGNYDDWVALPEGVTDAQSGLSTTTVSKLIEWAHLDFFITPRDYDPDLEDFPGEIDDDY